MAEFVRPIAESCAAGIEVLGLAVIIGFATVSLILGAVGLARKKARHEVFTEVRQRLGRGILLGLEFLVTADIVHAVAVELTYESVGVLVVIVLVRTLLSFTLDLELTGRWPWQRKAIAEN